MTVLGEFLPDGPAFPKGRSWPLVVIESNSPKTVVARQNLNGGFRFKSVHKFHLVGLDNAGTRAKARTATTAPAMPVALNPIAAITPPPRVAPMPCPK